MRAGRAFAMVMFLLQSTASSLTAQGNGPPTGIIVTFDSSATPLISGSRNSGNENWWKFGAQDWWLNDIDQQRVYMEGLLVGMARNNAWPWYDDDYNLCIQPFVPYAWVAYNPQWHRYNPASSDCDAQQLTGMVEAEIRSDVSWNWLTSRFSTGQGVAAYGWWPHDNGHPNHATELHPLIWMSTTGVADIHPLVAAADLSGRFDYSKWWSIDETVDVIYQPNERALIEGSGVNLMPIHVLEEDAQAQWMGAQVAADRVSINLWLPPQCVRVPNQTQSLCQLNTAVLGYTSDLRHSMPSLLHENTNIGTGLDQESGKKIIIYTISDTVASPDGAPLKWVSWNWFDKPAGLPHPIVQNAAPFTQSVQLRYGPGAGYSQYEWALDIAGASASVTELQKIERDAWSSDPIGYDRKFIGTQRTYRIEPSSISLTTNQPRVHYPNPACPDTQTVQLHEKLVPGVQLQGNPAWSVQAGYYENPGQVAAMTTWQMLPPTAEHHDFKAPAVVPNISTLIVQSWVDPEDPLKLHVEFPNARMGQQRWATVAASATTDIGEYVDATFEVSSACPGDNVAAAIDRELPHIYEPGDPADSTLSLVMTRQGYPLDLSGLPQQARAADRRWVSAYVKWRTGQPLTQSEHQLLARELVAGRALHAIRPPAANAQYLQRHPVAVQPLAVNHQVQRLPIMHSAPSQPEIGMACARRARGLQSKSSSRTTPLTCKLGSDNQTRWQQP